MVGIAQLVSAPDCGSGGQGFESLYPPFTIISIYQLDSLGYRQAVRHRILIPAFAGSNPAGPVTGLCIYRGVLAQLVEHLTFNQVVAGSNPACLSTFRSCGYICPQLFIFPFYYSRIRIDSVYKKEGSLCFPSYSDTIS